jgi:hypothetical protein
LAFTFELLSVFKVEGDKTNEIPSQIVLEGEAIPVIVNTDFQMPARLPKMQASA